MTLYFCIDVFHFSQKKDVGVFAAGIHYDKNKACGLGVPLPWCTK